MLEWRRGFGMWNSFAWTPEIMARRVYNLACAGPLLAGRRLCVPRSPALARRTVRVRLC